MYVCMCVCVCIYMCIYKYISRTPNPKARTPIPNLKTHRVPALPGAIRGQLFGLSHRGVYSPGSTRPGTWGLVRPGRPEPEPEQLIGLFSPETPIPVNMPDSKLPENSPVQQPEQV